LYRGKKTQLARLGYDLQNSLQVKASFDRAFLEAVRFFRPLKKRKSRVPPAGLQSFSWIPDCCLFFAPKGRDF